MRSQKDKKIHKNASSKAMPMPKPDHKYLDLWVIEDNDEMRATLVEVIDSDAEMVCSSIFR